MLSIHRDSWHFRLMRAHFDCKQSDISTTSPVTVQCYYDNPIHHIILSSSILLHLLGGLGVQVRSTFKHRATYAKKMGTSYEFNAPVKFI